MDEYKPEEEPTTVLDDKEEEEADFDSVAIDQTIDYCVQNFFTTSPLIYSDVLEKILSVLESKKEEASKIFSADSIFQGLYQNLDISNENQAIKTIQIFRVLFEYTEQINENNFLSPDFLNFLISLMLTNKSIPLFGDIIELAHCIAEISYESTNILGLSGFIRTFVQCFQELLSTTEIPSELQESRLNCLIDGARFIEVLFSFKDFVPEEELVPPLLNILFEMMKESENNLLITVIDTFQTILSYWCLLTWKFFKPYISQMVEFIKNSAQNEEFDLASGMMDVFYLGLIEDTNEYLQEIHSTGLIPLVYTISEQHEEVCESAGDLLHALLEDKYIADEDLQFPLKYLQFVNPDSSLNLKKISAKMFKTMSQLFPDAIIQYIKEHLEIIEVLCTIIETEDWDVIFNVFDGFSDIIMYMREKSMEMDFLLNIFGEFSIDEEKISSLIEDAEQLSDREISAALERFNQIMIGEDEDETMNFAPPGGFEFSLE